MHVELSENERRGLRHCICRCSASLIFVLTSSLPDLIRLRTEVMDWQSPDERVLRRTKVRQSMRRRSWFGPSDWLSKLHFSMDDRVKPGGDEGITSLFDKARAHPRRENETLFHLSPEGRA